MTTVADVDALSAGLIDCTLPRPQWTHEAHLKAGLWHALHYAAPQALELLRSRICAYNVACGIANTPTSGYHETITHFYANVIDRFVQDADRSRPIDELATALINGLGARDLPLRFYSRERLLSTAARLEWLEPDLAALP